MMMLLAASAFAQQRAPEIHFTSVPDYPNLPAGMNFGEVPGVAVNSKGHVFVFSRSNSANGPAFGAAAAQLFEFDQNGNFVREIGKGLYAWSEAHSVRIDRNDNIWAIDKGSNMVVASTRRAASCGCSAGSRKRPTAPSRLGIPIRRCRRWTATSVSRPTWRGTRKATPTSPTGMSTRASPSTTRTATG
jgi:hypothetical protein